MANLYDLTDYWNNAGQTFTAIKMNVTDGASQAGSLLLDLQVGGSSKFAVRKDGVAVVPLKAYAGTLAAAGNTQGTAALVTLPWTRLTATANDQGAQAPAATVGACCFVLNDTDYRLRFYPAVGEAIGGMAANQYVSLPGRTSIRLRCWTAGVWTSDEGANSANGPLPNGLLRANNGGGFGNAVDLCNPNGTPLFSFGAGGGILNLSTLPLRMPGDNNTYFMQWVDGGNQGRGAFQVVNVNELSIQTRATGGYVKSAQFYPAESGVNFVGFTAAATGAPAKVSAKGGDANVDLLLEGLGTGLVRFGAYQVDGAVAAQGYLRIKAADGTIIRLLARSDT